MNCEDAMIEMFLEVEREPDGYVVVLWTEDAARARTAPFPNADAAVACAHGLVDRVAELVRAHTLVEPPDVEAARAAQLEMAGFLRDDGRLV
jgi:hypothetical protein